MLAELRVANLGVIDEIAVVLDSGLTALTGETGAGKTLIVDAIGLLLGANPDPMMVRPGEAEAFVEGRFVESDGSETVLRRVIPRSGRSRAYIDGRMAGAGQLSELGTSLVDMHGQHGHQSLLRPAVQRAMLDRFGGITTDEVQTARRELRKIAESQAAIGGDARNRAREADLLRFQLSELDGAGIDSPDEDELLRREEERLADASSLREAASRARDLVGGDGGVGDRLGELVALMSGKEALAHLRDRAMAVADETADLARELRSAEETFEDDPERLAEVGARRQVLTELRRKYGETLADVIAFREEARSRLETLESYESRAAELEHEHERAAAELAAAEVRLREARLAAAPRFGRSVEEILRELAMPHATFQVEVGEDAPGDSVTWNLGANPGEAVLPLSKVASGGELARTMLAARLVLGGTRGGGDTEQGGGPSTLVFDEVDAGIGGEAATAVGRALASLGRDYQVLVVTHLPQVASFADRHLVVQKRVDGARTVAEVDAVDGAPRVIELSRMLSGSPDSESARRHAEELLTSARPGREEAATRQGAARRAKGVQQ
ncbi:MAG TPA: DNA repair protein RecN [Acidimicrobiales bacterium]|nr:DNA repair protein RecN [Acidimicrobiales bacterium]